MAIRSDEIISIIKDSIERFEETAESRNVGTVVEVGDGIARVYGLDAALASELVWIWPPALALGLMLFGVRRARSRRLPGGHV